MIISKKEKYTIKDITLQDLQETGIEFIKDTFIRFGANEDIYYLSKPHIGSDVLVNIIKNFSNISFVIKKLFYNFNSFFWRTLFIF